MKKVLISLFLFVLQIWVVVKGNDIFGKWVNPFVLFIVSLSIAIYFFYSILYEKTEQHLNIKSKPIIGFGIGLISILLLIPSFRHVMSEYPNPENFSDVIPQLKTQYLRFSKGEFPYKELDQFMWKPYPVYMPLHWLPLSIPTAFGKDVRWIGIFLVAISTGVWGAFIWKKDIGTFTKLLAICLPAMVIVAFFIQRRSDIAVSLETIIAAYYLILAIGLAERNLVLVTIGIILCLLSRYTVIFWLPLFMLILWREQSKRKNIWVWLSIIAAVIFIYILPFYAKDPTILSKGLSYHNRCAIDEWRGYGYPPVSPSFEYGLHFAGHLKRIFTGDAAHMVFMDRILQSVLMLALILTGLIFYNSWKSRINFFDLLLGFLYLTILFFYMFGPLVYLYYYIPVLMITAIICGRIITTAFIKQA